MPLPSQRVASVCVFPVQLLAGPQEVELLGKVQAPLKKSQSVEPQGGVTFGHAAAQQCPVPVTPQKPETQASLVLQFPFFCWAMQLPLTQ